MQKFCTECGRLIAEERGGEYYDVIRRKPMSYYGWIRRKYCPRCANEVQDRQKLNWIHDKRYLNKGINKALRKRVELLEVENGYFRDLLVKAGVL